MTKTIHLGRTLRDGQGTAGTNLLLRKIRAKGAEVALAKTGRVTVTIGGQKTVYVAEHPTCYDDALATEALGARSPLQRALADLEAA